MGKLPAKVRPLVDEYLRLGKVRKNLETELAAVKVAENTAYEAISKYCDHKFADGTEAWEERYGFAYNFCSICGEGDY